MQDVKFGNTAGLFAVTSVPEMVSSVFLYWAHFVCPASKELNTSIQSLHQMVNDLNPTTSTILSHRMEVTKWLASHTDFYI
jgi:choline-glycine betaine transporter